MDALDRYMNHFRRCGVCKPATVEDPVCVPCPTGQRLWAALLREGRTYAASDPTPAPSCYPLGGLNEYDDAA